MEANLQLSKQSRPLFAKVYVAIVVGFFLTAVAASLTQRGPAVAASQPPRIAQGK